MILVAGALAGCGVEPSLSLREWTLTVEGEAAGRPLTLPARLDLPDRPARYALSTDAALPPELRGGTLTLVVPMLRAPATLRVNGEQVAPLETWTSVRYRHPGWQAWRIEPSLTGGPSLALRIEVEHRSAYSARLYTVPRLSASDYGDRLYLAVRGFNEVSALTGLGVLGLIVYVYFVSFLFDRKRVAQGWFSLHALSGFLIVLHHIGFSQLLLGEHDALLINGALVVGGLSGACFARTHFGVGPPSRWLLLALAPEVLVILLWTGPFDGLRYGPPAGILAAALCVGDVVVVSVRQLGGPRRLDAIVLLAGWALVWLMSAPELLVRSGVGAIAGLGLDTVPFGYMIFTVLQATLLSRERVLSLDRADRLNVELATRVRELKGRNAEVQLLNVELSRQIAERSRELYELLGRLATATKQELQLAPGDVVERRYEVVRAIGEGGMGRVYEVERLADRRRLALKIIRGNADETQLARLAREAQVAAELSHPNLVAVLDVGIAQSGLLFIVMELVPGTSLADQRARYGDVPWALDVLAQVAKGMEAMHARGVIHRDLKPANVLVDGATVKIADFGLAGLGEAATQYLAQPPREAAGNEATAVRGVTRTGLTMGTPAYMAPELFVGAPRAAPEADIYSAGVMAYELLSGARPHSDAAVLERLHGRPLPPPRALAEVCPSLPAALASLIGRCLDDAPAARPTARELAAGLAEALRACTSSGTSAA